MADASIKGFLLIDGSKNTLLLPKEDFFDGDIDKVITKHIGKAKRHATNTELFNDIRAYLKCEYVDGHGLHERGDAT